MRRDRGGSCDALRCRSILAPAAEGFVAREEGLRAVLGAAGGLERHEELMDERRAGQGNAPRAGGLQDDREVLLLVLDREGGLEIAVDHLLSEHLERPRIRRARRESLVEKMIDRDIKPAFAVKHQQKDLAI